MVNSSIGNASSFSPKGLQFESCLQPCFVMLAPFSNSLVFKGVCLFQMLPPLKGGFLSYYAHKGVWQGWGRGWVP
jgi:hypothetical protein